MEGLNNQNMFLIFQKFMEQINPDFLNLQNEFDMNDMNEGKKSKKKNKKNKKK